MEIYTWLEYFKEGKSLGKIALPESSDLELRIILYKHFIKYQNYITNLPPDNVLLVQKGSVIDNSAVKEIIVDRVIQGCKLIDEIKDIDYAKIWNDYRNTDSLTLKTEDRDDS